MPRYTPQQEAELQALAERLWPRTAPMLKCESCGGAAEMRVVDTDEETRRETWARVCLKCGEGNR